MAAGSNSTLQHVYDKAISEGLLQAPPETIPEDVVPALIEPPMETFVLPAEEEDAVRVNETEREIPDLTLMQVRLAIPTVVPTLTSVPRYRSLCVLPPGRGCRRCENGLSTRRRFSSKNSALAGVAEAVRVRLSQVASFALPALGAVLADPLMSLVDTACVGQISSVGLAALGPNTAVFGFVSMLFQFLTTATTAMVARAYSRGELKELSRCVGDGVLLAGLMGTVCTAILVFCSSPILGLLNTPRCVPPSAPLFSPLLYHPPTTGTSHVNDVVASTLGRMMVAGVWCTAAICWRRPPATCSTAPWRYPPRWCPWWAPPRAWGSATRRRLCAWRGSPGW